MDVFRCGWSQQSQERVFLWWWDSSFMGLMLESDRPSKGRSDFHFGLSLLMCFKSRPHLYEWGGFYS